MITTKDTHILLEYFDNICTDEFIELMISDSAFAPFIEKDNTLTLMPSNFPRANSLSIAALEGKLVLCRPSYAGNETTILNCITNETMTLKDEDCEDKNLVFLGEIVKITY